MSIQPFYLSDGSYFYCKVTESHVIQITLFSSSKTYEKYPLDVKQLVGKVALFALKEISEEQFLEAQTKWLIALDYLGTLTIPITLPPPTPKQIEQAAIVVDALKDELPF